MLKNLLLTSCLLAVSYFSQAQLQIRAVGGTASLGYNSNGGVAEITAFDPITKQLFCINGVANIIAVYDFSNPATNGMSPVSTFSITGAGSINSIACYQGLLAVVYENQLDRTQAGAVQLYKTSDLSLIGSPITVGAQPDMITFTPDGKKLLVANEGEPNNAYTVDPEGSVTIIDVTSPASPGVSQISLSSLNGTVPHLSTQPVVTPSIRIFGMINSETVVGTSLTNTKTPSTVAQDLEPEYITVSPDGNTAWVTCQENNAVLVINVANASIVTLVGLGYKDHNLMGNGMDITNAPANTAGVNITTYPLKGMYQPDGISVTYIGGVPYLFTANEGDARDYPGFGEEIAPNAAFFNRINNGASPAVNSLITTSGIRISNTMGNIDGGMPYMSNSVVGTNINSGNNFEELYTFGTRSFSVWNGLTGALVWDSGDQFERQTLAAFPNNFNANHNGAAGNTIKGRSRNKGPEPESIVTAVLGDSVYAFIGLERIGGVMVYNVTNPIAPFFKQYLNTRNFSVIPTAAGTDLGPEGLTLIKASESPNGLPYLVVSNEISGTVRIFALENRVVQNRTVFLSIPSNQSVSGAALLTLSGAGLPSPLAFSAPAGFEISSAAGSGFGSSLNLSHSGNVFNLPVFVRYTGTAPYTSGFVTITGANMAISQVLLAGENLKFAQSEKSATSSQSSYLFSTVPGAKFTAMMTVGDQVGGYAFCGIPDGVGAYDNNDGTFTMLINHEIGNTNGAIRAHGGRGAFVSQWVISKSTLAVQSGSDLIRDVKLFNATTLGYTTFNMANTIAGLNMGRFCSADLPAVSAFYNSITGLGTQDRLFMNGEEIGAEGRGFAHVATGNEKSTSYELPRMGKYSFENIVANPFRQNKTIAVGTDDATPGQVYVYIGTKQSSGNVIEKAGLTNGKLYGIAVSGMLTENNTTTGVKTTFTLVDLGNVETMTGAALQTMSNNLGVTQFLRPEDAAWDPSSLTDLYFATTNAFTAPSRLWKASFTDITNPELGGTIEAVLDGTEGQRMLDNIGIDNFGHVLMVEDVGNNAHLGRVLQYDIVTDKMTTVGSHDPIRFSTLGGANLLTQDEEASGIVDVQDILGQGMFLVVDQAHYALPGELVEGGQMLAYFNPDTFRGRTPSITVTSANLTSGGANLNLNTLVASNSTGAISYSVSGANASVVSANQLQYFDAGVVTIMGTIASITGFKSAMFTTTVTIAKQNAMLTFSGAMLTIGGAVLNISSLLNTNSNGVKSFTITGTAATLSGSNVLTAVEAGMVTIAGSVASSAAFEASSITSAIFTIVKQNPNITFSGASLTLGGATLDFSSLFTSNSTGTKSFTVNGTAATISGSNILTGVSAGSVTVTGMVESTTGFNAGMAMAVFTIVKQNPNITFSGASLTVGGSSLDVSSLFTSNSTGTKSFTVNGSAATISGSNILTGVSAGSVTITGMVASTTGFNAGMAMAVFTIITVPSPIVKANPSITFTGATLTIGGANVNLATLFSTNATGTPSFMIDGTAASISGTNLVALSAGTVTITGSLTSTVGFNAASKTAVFTIVAGNSTSINAATYQSTTLTLYPNPVTNDLLHLNKTVSGFIYTTSGVEVLKFVNTNTLDVSKLNAGKYILKTINGDSIPFVVK